MSTTVFNHRTASNVGVACLMALHALIPGSLWGQANQGSNPGSGAITPGSTTATASGFVNGIAGTLYMRRGDGAEVEAKVGDVFGPGTTFRTGTEANAVLLFADGQNITLGRGSELKIGDYRFDTRDIKSSRATFALSTGIMRMVTGAIHADNSSGLVVSAGNASIGILSKDTTAFVVEVDPKSSGIGAAAVTIGEISVQTSAGRVERLESDQFTRWQTGLPPSLPVPIGAAPAAFQSVVAASRANVLGSNAPIDIQSAAVRAALGGLPPTGAGGNQGQILQAQATDSAPVIVAPATTSGGGRGCVGSPC